MPTSKTNTPWRDSKRQRTSNFPLKREAVLRTAAAIFRRNGFEETSLSELAAALNVTKPTIYYYVHSKDKLLLEVLKQAQLDVLSMIEAKVAESGSAYARLRAIMIEYALVMSSDYGACLSLISIASLEKKSQAEVRLRNDQANKMLAALILSGRKDKSLTLDSFSASNVDIVLRVLFGSLNWMPRWFRPNGALSPRKLAERHVDVLLNGIRHR